MATRCFDFSDIRIGGVLSPRDCKGCTMVPNYKDDNCTIYNADCGDVLPSLDRFDLLLTEAPQYPPGLSTKNRVRMASGMALASQSNGIGVLPAGQLLKAIAIADHAIVWQPSGYKLPSGNELEWCSNGHVFSSAWHNISTLRTDCWVPRQESDPNRLS